MNTTRDLFPSSFTVDCVGLLSGQEYTYTKTFSTAERAEAYAAEEMKWEGTKRVRCAELGFDLPGDYWNADGTRIGGAPLPIRNVYDLLLASPDGQVTRCQLAWKAVAAGEWAHAEHFLRNAVEEEGATAWSLAAQRLADNYRERVPA